MEGKQVWLGEPPPAWTADGDALQIRTKGNTDFWCRTFADQLSPEDYKTFGLPPGVYVRDNGHFYYEPVSDEFVATARVSGDYNSQYDQVGLMVRQDADTWLKASVEVVYGMWADRYPYSNPAYLISCTLTQNGWSEWSVLPESADNPSVVWIRVTREGPTYYVDYSVDGERFELIKVFSLPNAAEVMVGRYASSPAGDGFDARWDHYSLIRSHK